MGNGKAQAEPAEKKRQKPESARQEFLRSKNLRNEWNKLLQKEERKNMLTNK